VLAAVAVFALTYLAIAAGRFPWLSVDRPAAALLGAVLMVATRVLTPGEAGAAVNGETLGLLLGMMILAAYLAEAGFFRWASWRVIRAAGTPRALLWGLTLTAGALSAFLVNDTVCLMMTPLVVRLVDDADLPPLPFLLAVAFGSNAGSVATLTGNPQNMIVGTLSGIPYAAFARALALPAAASLVAVAALLQLLFRRELPRRPLAPSGLPPPALDRRLLAKGLLATGLAVAGFLAGLFVVVAGVGRAGVAEAMFRAVEPALGAGAPRQAAVFGLFAAGASQVVSNVPFVILAGQWIPRLADPTLLWLATALASTLAGNLTVVGSVANLIVLELAGPRGRVGFFRFLRYGAVVTGVTLAISFSILLAERAAGWIEPASSRRPELTVIPDGSAVAARIP
jgi:Na+/H+ antiporter NhaD/arsenite permease-like protein